MATAFSTLLKIALPTQGELSGSWGDVVNNNITSMVEEAIAGLKTINTWSGNSATLSTANGTTAESRAAMLLLTDTTSDLSGAATLICPALSKIFIVKNGAGQTVTVKTASGSGIAVSNGNTSILFCDGTNVVEAVTGITGNLDVGGNLTVGGNATVTGTTTFNGGTLTLGDSAADNVVFGADVNSSIIPNTDDTYDLGSASQEWRNLHLDGTANIDTLVADEATIDSININGKVITMTGDTSDTAVFTAGTNGTLTIVTTDAAGAAANITITADGTAELAGTTVTLNSGGDIVLDADGANVTFKDDGTSILDIANNSGDAELTVSTADKNFAIKGTDGSSAITALDIDMALAGKATFSGDVVVTGDLTISGDDLVMGTNTSGHILVADGTNFNPTAVGDLSEISTIASDDVFLAVDTSGGGLKKVARSVVVSGLATSSAISNVSEDSTPQLGGNLDLNGNDIVTTSNATLDLAPNGTGTVVVRGNTNSGAIVFNCESNSHGQTVIAQPHSAGVTNTMLLPAGANSTLVSLVSTDTLTNKTLTAPKIADGGFIADANGNELVIFQTTGSAVNQLEITNNASGSNPILAATGGDTNIGIALTPKGTGEIVIGAGNLNYGGTAVTSTGAELNALAGITAVVGELNALDLGSTAVGTAIASKAVILDSNKDYTGIRNLTVTGEVVGTGFTGTLDGVLGSGTAAAATTTTLAATTGTFSGVLKTDDTTDATSTTDGSLQTDGGLSVAKDAVIGDDLLLLSDASVIKFGADSEVTLTHVHNAGLILGGTAPSLTIGDAGAEDTKLVFDGNAQDFYVGLDDSADDLVIGLGSAVGTTPALSIDENVLVTVADDIKVVGRATSSTLTTHNMILNDGSTNEAVNLALGNNFISTTTANNTVFTFINPAIGQSGTVVFVNAGNHSVSMHASVNISAASLAVLQVTGTYMVSYFCKAASGNDTIFLSVSQALV